MHGVAATTTQHYEYVLLDGSASVYDIDNAFNLVKTISLPTSGTRGVVAHAGTGMMYVSYGSDSTGGSGSLLKYDLVHGTIVWTKSYSFPIDSMAISPDGTTIYMPTGENSSGGLWEVIDASTGDVIGSINSGGVGPHNTIVNAAGTHVYLGPRNTNNLVEASTSTDQIIKDIGPITTQNGSGVRPFTINGTESLAFMTATGVLGFQVGDINTGKILYVVPINGFTWNGTGVTCPSHGISISPDEKEIYVIDQPNSYVHVYDITGLPGTAPKQIADIPLIGKMTGNQTSCAYDCGKAGWLHHSRDGHYVFVGDSGDVIDTGTRTTVGTLPNMANSRQEIEIDFQNGVPVWAMNNRNSLGTVTGTTNAPPVITSATTAQGTVGQTFSYQITATNSPTSYGASPLPGGLSVNTSTGVISGTPTTAGTYTVTLSATNSYGTGKATLTINVSSTSGSAPVITSATSATARVGTAFSYRITATNNPTSYGASPLPAGLSINTSTGLISGTPTAAGTYTVTLSATNTYGTGKATLILIVGHGHKY